MVKTHGGPIDDDPTIYIVRDGRMATVSYFHYLNSYVRQPVTLEDIIVGRQWPGSWSQHYKAWRPAERKSTLLITFEELRDDNMSACKKIGQFLQREPLKNFDISFSELQQLNPKFFRSANDEKSLSEIQPMIDLFLEHHGETMKELGYKV